MAGNRDYSLDALKMILIILVIYAHIPLLNGLIPIGANVECDALTWHSVKGIYAFHMPLFVFLSGYLTKRKLLAVQFGKSQKLIKLFVVFHIVDLVLKWIVAGVRHSLHGIVCPSFALWYLLCLFLLENTDIRITGKYKQEVCRFIFCSVEFVGRIHSYTR